MEGALPSFVESSNPDQGEETFTIDAIIKNACGNVDLRFFASRLPFVVRQCRLWVLIVGGASPIDPLVAQPIFFHLHLQAFS